MVTFWEATETFLFTLHLSGHQTHGIKPVHTGSCFLTNLDITTVI